ncbi:hypothetical protein GXM_05313 [Nostoc sphaeroides CCNUC1]|uniref:Uncharacterized protein n=1 Tax=Nostoc sphaeroides CCNUC1 TaxID=2653204 RepID=A0A5P8W5M6_9NOSO|nr:hypothetical protein GXM_05313 [Nostoc sphaeroides CCNUC1]
MDFGLFLWYKPRKKVGGKNLKDATYSRFPRRYRKSKIQN